LAAASLNDRIQFEIRDEIRAVFSSWLNAHSIREVADNRLDFRYWAFFAFFGVKNCLNMSGKITYKALIYKDNTAYRIGLRDVCATPPGKASFDHL
jgi:hypothetical protein